MTRTRDLHAEGPAMNEILPGDPTGYSAPPPIATVIGVLALFHLVCCGLALLLLSGVSLAALYPSPQVLGLLAFTLVAFAFNCIRARSCAWSDGCTARQATRNAASEPGEAG